MKKITKNSFTMMLIFAMVMQYFIPFGSVFADGEYVLSFTATGEHVMENDGGHLKIDGQYVDLRDSDEHNIGTVNCTSDKACTITVSDGTKGKLSYFANSKFTLYLHGRAHTFDEEYTLNESFAVQDYEKPQNNQGGEEVNSNFDGKAYLVWSCGNGICYHYFNDIPDFNDGNSTFYKDTEITADNKDGVTFDMNAEYKGWYLADTFNEWIELYEVATGEVLNWNIVAPELILGAPKSGDYLNNLETKAINAGVCVKPAQDASRDEHDAFESCINLYAAQTEHEIWTHQLQPVGEPQYKNAYVSYGDRNFKVVIYNSNYKGVTIGSLDELNYYPAEWSNAFIKRDQYDISGTSKNKPTGIDTILLEKVVRIKEINVNGFTITKIKALDVPEDAVAITHEDGEWRFEFSSNFYDNVVFEVTDSNNGVSYIQIKRTTIDAWIPNIGGHPVLHADFWFDRNKKYSDFDLTAIIEYKDGTERNVKLEAVFGIDDGLGNISEVYEQDEENPAFGPKGKGLKKASFEYRLEDDEDKKIERVYLNAEYKGSTETTYAGSYAGSGKGVLANIYVPEEGEE